MPSTTAHGYMLTLEAATFCALLAGHVPTEIGHLTPVIDLKLNDNALSGRCDGVTLVSGCTARVGVDE